MTDAQVFMWIFFSCLCAYMGFMIGKIQESDLADRLLVEEFLKYEQQKESEKKRHSSQDQNTNENRFHSLSSINAQGETDLH